MKTEGILKAVKKTLKKLMPRQKVKKEAPFYGDNFPGIRGRLAY